MKSIRRFFSRFVSTFVPQRSDAAFSAEFEEHIAELTEENIRAGMAPDEARRVAILKFGPVGSLKEDFRDQRGLPFLETFFQDLRYAFRTLRRDSGFALVAVAILSIGIGANTAIFSVVNTLVLRSLPFYASDRLVWIENEFPNHKAAGLSGITSRVAVYWEWQKLNQSFEQMEAYNAFFGRSSYSISGDREPERVIGVEVSKNLFPMLGVRPMLGRTFVENEVQLNGARAVLISYGLWQRRFGSDPSIVGKSVRVNDSPVTVVGVMPREFDFGSVFAPGIRTDLFLPLVLDEVKNWGHTLAIVGRLKPGVSIQQARAEFRVLNEQIATAHPDWRNWFGSYMQPLHDSVSGRVKAGILLLAGAVGVVLLIVCVNVGNLLLARAASRRQEMAVRAALGASRGRVIRQMLTESLLLAGAGGVVGALIAGFATELLSRMRGVTLPLLERVHVDGIALVFAVGVTMLTGILFGLVPALELSRSDIQEGLKDASRGSSEGHRKTWLRNGLVISEVALACILVAGTGLLVRSFLRVLDIDLGFRPERVAALRIDPSSKYETDKKSLAFIEEIVRRVREVPGVESVSGTDALPLDRNRSWGIAAKGQIDPKSMSDPTKGWISAYVRFVLPGYFKTMGIPIRAGEEFTERDREGKTPVIIINETAARRLWPGQNAVGQIAYGGGSEERRVAAVVADVRHSGPEEQAGVEMYMPVAQSENRSVDLVMRTTLDPKALASVVRATLRPLDPTLPITEFRPMQDLVDRAVSPRRVIVWLLAGFAVIAVVLASLGIYGVVSYTVSRRTQEIGIRMALGASARNVQMDVLGHTLKLVSIGVVCGVSVSLILSSLIESQLYGVGARDPLTYLAAPAVLVIVALFAALLPSRRASKVDPMTALRAS